MLQPISGSLHMFLRSCALQVSSWDPTCHAQDAEYESMQCPEKSRSEVPLVFERCQQQVQAANVDMMYM